VHWPRCLTEPKKHSEEDRGSHASFEKAANLIVKRVERQAPPLRRRRFVDIRCFRPAADGAAQFWIAADEIDRLVLGAEGRRAVLHSQFAVQLDDVGERLCAEFVSSVGDSAIFSASAFDELAP